MDGGAKPARVLLVGDDPRAATTLAEMLRAVWPQGLLIIQTQHVADAIHELTGHGATCVLLDLLPAREQPLAALEQLAAAAPDVAVIVVSEHGDDALGTAAIAAGAQDHLLRSELHPAMLGRAVRYAVERKRSEADLTRQALHDPLTALPNRALFLDRLKVALDRSRRTALPVAIMFLDVDSFKEINDTLGHAAGDALLSELAVRFGALLRPMDTVARFGGDEFTFLFEGLEGKEEAMQIAGRIRAAAGRAIPLGQPAVQTSVAVSIGVTMVEDPTAAPEDLIGEADAAMYRAKGSGTGGCVVHGATEPLVAAEPLTAAEPATDPAATSAATSAAAPGAIGAALRDGQLRVHYQPRVSINGETGLVGFEALVRWAHPERGLIEPRGFVPLAEESGLIASIDEWVLGQAVRQIADWRHTRPGMAVSVNLSSDGLRDPELPGRVQRLLNDAGAGPGALWLEVSEAALQDDPVAAGRTLGELRELGVGVALDDFGTGRMGLADLRRLPIGMLKLHESFVAGLGADGQPALVAAVIELAHALGLSVIAEGVETDDQLGALRDLGCDGAQGYLFSRPVPSDEVGALLGA